MGAAYIRSYLEQHNVKTAQFLTSKEETIPEIIKHILECNPEAVGFTCYDANYAYVRILAQLLKKKAPTLPLILGGPTATFSPEPIMEHTPEIDVCVRGEGEKTTLELLKNTGEGTESIQGITFHSGNEFISTRDRPLMSGEKGAELDGVPSPYLTRLISPDGRAGILTARGCVYHCTYCNFSTMFNHTIRYHSVDRVIEELRLIADHWDPQSRENIQIHDDIFSLNLNRAKTMCQRIIDEGIKLPFFVETRADNCDRELIELMKDAGVKTINFGLESASCRVLRNIKKAPGKEERFLTQIKSSVGWAREAGLTTTVSIILGMPGEGVKEAEETLNFVKELDVDEYYHNVLFLFAGTELFHKREDYGLKVAHSPYFLPYLTQHTYDVGKIRCLPHAILHKQLKSWEKVYYDLLTYGGGRNPEKFKHLIVAGFPKDLGGFCTWLQKICVLHLTVVDLTPNMTKEEVANRLKALLEGHVPVGFYSTVEGEGRSQLFKLYSQVELCAPVPEVPFHCYENGMNALFTLEKVEDVKKLAEFIDDHVEEGILHVSTRKLPKLLIGACRWGEVLCPSLSRGILVIDGENVVSCYRGGCIGKVGDSTERLRGSIQALLREKAEKRGCHHCEVASCSRCLFPPFRAGEFCELKRRYPRISTFITVLEWLHVFSRNEEGDIMLRVDKGAPPLFYRGEIRKGDLPKVRDDVILLSFGGKAFAFTAEEMKGFSLEPGLAALLEACQLGGDRERLVSHVCESEKVTREEASRTISNALTVFEGVGFLTRDV